MTRLGILLPAGATLPAEARNAVRIGSPIESSRESAMVTETCTCSPGNVGKGILPMNEVLPGVRPTRGTSESRVPVATAFTKAYAGPRGWLAADLTPHASIRASSQRSMAVIGAVDSAR